MIAYSNMDPYKTQERQFGINIVTMFHKVLIKITVLRDWTQSNSITKGNNS